jgi:hypothetical protein
METARPRPQRQERQEVFQHPRAHIDSCQTAACAKTVAHGMPVAAVRFVRAAGWTNAVLAPSDTCSTTRLSSIQFRHGATGGAASRGRRYLRQPLSGETFVSVRG